MSNGSPEIPDVQGVDPPIARILTPMRTLLLVLTGRTGKGKIELLGTGATTQAQIAKINEIINRLDQ